nr:putative late blight resistance protein homolog R1B-14 [Ipomoea batatas]
MEFGVVTSLLGIVEQQLIRHPHRCLILLPDDTQIIIESLSDKLRFLQAYLQESDPEAQTVLHHRIRDVAAEAEDKIESKLSDVYLAAAKGEHAASSVEAACEDLHHTLQQVVRDIESVEVGVRDHLQQQKQIKPHTSSSLDSDDDASSSETPSSSLQHIRDALTTTGSLSNFQLFKLQNLQTLVLSSWMEECHLQLPNDILDLPWLRHVRLDKGSSLDLPSSVQKNLQTLFWLKVTSWDSKPLDFTRIPNLKELGIYMEGKMSSYALHGLAQLDRLEKLKFELGRAEHFCLPISFPPNLKKLTLCKTYLPWEEMYIISKLRNLEVLKLKDFAFCGPVWKLSYETFHQLKFLLVAHSDLEHWDADVYNVFPVLECLALRCCWYLKELPSDFVLSSDLQLIELIDCCPSLVDSAKMIQQETYGNGELVVRHFFTEIGSKPSSRWITCRKNQWPITQATHGNHALDRIRSFLHFGKDLYLAKCRLEFPCLKLLRVLDLSLIKYWHGVPSGLEDLIHLRYLGLTTIGSLYNFQLLKLKNLQTLVVHSWTEEDRLQLPINILDLPLLRHAHLSKRAALYLPNVVQESLQSLYWVKVANVNQETNFKRVPKLKELGIYIDDKLPHGALDSLVHLHQLEKLKFEVGRAECFSLPAALSPHLKTLSLRYTYLPWKQIDIIGKLLHLEVLKLKDFAFCGSKWNPSEEGFKKLQFFLIARSDLKHWTAGSEHFPVLKRLVLKNCWDLVNIPIEFADINTLESIELESCYSSLVKSAKEIQKDQLENIGNDSLLIHELGIKEKTPEEESETEEEDSEGSDDDLWALVSPPSPSCRRQNLSVWAPQARQLEPYLP